MAKGPLETVAQTLSPSNLFTMITNRNDVIIFGFIRAEFVYFLLRRSSATTSSRTWFWWRYIILISCERFIIIAGSIPGSLVGWFLKQSRFYNAKFQPLRSKSPRRTEISGRALNLIRTTHSDVLKTVAQPYFK